MTSEFEFILEDTLAKARAVLAKVENPRIAYSGGSDSDVLIDLIHRFIGPTKSVFYDTGVEYQATYDHVKEMGEKYVIEIVRPEMTIPTILREYGNPFMSKVVSQLVSGMQRHGFKFKEHGHLSYEELRELYPTYKTGIKWWHNKYGKRSRYAIQRNLFMKEFLIEHGDELKVSRMCCIKAKKLPSSRHARKHNIDLIMMGTRRSEGGVRASSIKECFVPRSERIKYDRYHTIFFWDDKMMAWYKEKYGIVHSRAYTVYGLTGTGCAGCPMASGFEYDMEVLKEYEPKRYKAMKNIFGEAHEYRRKYNKFKEDLKAERKANNQRIYVK